MQEEFRSIKGYEGTYEVSNLGNVKSLNYKNSKTERLLKPCFDSDGYHHVGLYKNKKSKTFKIHKLVAVMFLNHKPCGMKLVVDHIDNNKLNNRFDNLQVISTRENASKDRFGGSSKYLGVSKDKGSGKWRAQIILSNKVKNLGRFINEIDAHNAYQTALKTLLESTT
jgi:hypothetical protein